MGAGLVVAIILSAVIALVARKNVFAVFFFVVAGGLFGMVVYVAAQAAAMH